MKLNVGYIAKVLEGMVVGDNEQIISMPAKIEDAVNGNITFLANPKYEPYVYTTKASAILVPMDFNPISVLKVTLIKVDDVYTALSKVLSLFDVKSFEAPSISDNCTLAKNVVLGKGITIGHYSIIKNGVEIGDDSIVMDQVFLGENVKIGSNTIIYPGVKVYYDCIIGDNCIIHSNVVIGSDGFGFSRNKKGEFEKIPQIGNVVIGNNVEIGACTSIDRATMGSTYIKDGVKLDNLIQVAHNVTIGKNTAIAAQAGVSGSTEIGENCMIGGQVGFVGHIKIADNTMIQAQSGVAGNVTEPGRKLYGYPAIDYQKYLRAFAYFKKLPEIVARLREIENEIFKK